MYGSELTCISYWWIVPLIMMFMCFFMMRRRWGSMMCGFGSRGRDSDRFGRADSAREILDKRYASGEISRDEYEEIKETMANTPDERSE